jgi:hypothetical protein
MYSELRYFAVFDLYYVPKAPYNTARKPTIVTYQHDGISFKEILKKYLELCPNFKKVNLNFTLSEGYTIPMRFTVLDLKN